MPPAVLTEEEVNSLTLDAVLNEIKNQKRIEDEAIDTIATTSINLTSLIKHAFELFRTRKDDDEVLLGLLVKERQQKTITTQVSCKSFIFLFLFPFLFVYPVMLTKREGDQRKHFSSGIEGEARRDYSKVGWRIVI